MQSKIKGCDKIKKSTIKYLRNYFLEKYYILSISLINCMKWVE